MQQQNQGKLTIQQGAKYGETINWGPILGEKEYLYISEAEEEFETVSWHKAEEICQTKLDESQAVLVKSYRRSNESDWESFGEKILFIGK